MDFIARTQAHNAFITPSPTATYITTLTGGASATSFTGSATIPASSKPRLVVFAMALSNVTLTFTAAAIGNIPLTITNYLPAGDNTTAAIAYGVLPANTSGLQTVYTAFSGTNGGNSGAAVSVYVCDNIASASPIATFTSDCGSGATTPVSISMNSQPNGIAIAAFAEAGGTGGLVTWSAGSNCTITEDYDAVANSRAASTARGTSSFSTFTATFATSSVNTNKALIVMTFR